MENNAEQTKPLETNQYEDREKRKFQPKSKIKTREKEIPVENKNEKLISTAKDVGSDLLIGVLGGGLLAATLGRPAFLVGLGISGYAHHTNNNSLKALGLGMMASGTMSALNGKIIDPKLPAADQMMERVKAFGMELKRKLFIDKLIPEKKLPVATNPVDGIKRTRPCKKIQNLSSNIHLYRRILLKNRTRRRLEMTKIRTRLLNRTKSILCTPIIPGRRR